MRRGVQRFRTVEEMGRAVVPAAVGDGFDRFARHCARYWALAPRRYPRGVFRFKTIEAAQAARAAVAAGSGVVPRDAVGGVG